MTAGTGVTVTGAALLVKLAPALGRAAATAVPDAACATGVTAVTAVAPATEAEDVLFWARVGVDGGVEVRGGSSAETCKDDNSLLDSFSVDFLGRFVFGAFKRDNGSVG